METQKTVAIATALVILLGASAAQAAVCAEESPDWVYVIIITGTKSQDIDIDQLIPNGYR